MQYKVTFGNFSNWEMEKIVEVNNYNAVVDTLINDLESKCGERYFLEDKDEIKDYAGQYIIGGDNNRYLYTGGKISIEQINSRNQIMSNEVECKLSTVWETYSLQQTGWLEEMIYMFNANPGRYFLFVNAFMHESMMFCIDDIKKDEDIREMYEAFLKDTKQDLFFFDTKKFKYLRVGMPESIENRYRVKDNGYYYDTVTNLFIPIKDETDIINQIHNYMKQYFDMTPQQKRVLKQMTEIVKENVTHYASDYYQYDIEDIVTKKDTVFIWAVRETGTWLMPFHDLKDNTQDNILLNYTESENSILSRVSIRFDLKDHREHVCVAPRQHTFYVIDLLDGRVLPL